jgi:pimeloyl-ACP methyl ester carboxylesterase
MTIPPLALSGWAQPYDALAHLMPEAHHLPYAAYGSWETLVTALTPHADTPLAVGWSLGGALLMRAAALGVIRPKKLVLLAAPVQFVADDTFPHGMGRETFTLFRHNFLENPHKTARRFAHLIADGDTHYEAVVHHLQQHSKVDYTPWGQWLDGLGAQRHDQFTLHNLPPTLLIYGEKDGIVSHKQGEYLHGILPHSRLMLLPECAHAPHVHDLEKVRHAIKEWQHVATF